MGTRGEAPTGAPVGRRALLALGLGLGAAVRLDVLGAPGAPARAAARSVQPVPVAARRRAIAFLDAMMDAHATGERLRLPTSFADQARLYGTAFTYDAALAILAYLADTRTESFQRARLLGRSLVYAQQHDPLASDGRLRQAYTVGPTTADAGREPDAFVNADGTVNIGGAYGSTASGTGEQAWAGLALCALYRRTRDAQLLAAATRLASWVVDTCTSAGALGGFTGGIDRDGRPRPQASTGHNADLAAFFSRLADLTGERAWRTHRERAAAFVTRMWDADRQAYATGSPDGATIDTESLWLEAQTHPWLAFTTPGHAGCLTTVARRLAVTDTSASPNSALSGNLRLRGVTVSAASRTAATATPIEPGLPAPDPDAVWLEGTAQYAAALQRTGRGAAAADPWLRELALAQNRLGAGQTVAGKALPARSGLQAASSPLHVGEGASGYLPVLHVGTTAWYVLAATGTDPLRAPATTRGTAQTQQTTPAPAAGRARAKRRVAARRRARRRRRTRARARAKLRKLRRQGRRGVG
ncbi:Tat pathway signal sequence domain protein [Planomonospora parontospora]|uniref:Tat pathway signal sequence domain protein n=1 Tax=Planomonospora parontospora TaxID=58119 RepID=UPI001670E3AF|nr:Tat pathway signal sequence domain protein [Planomonospora parontospora]GGL30300.1 hypothetical protein GCM10014719_34610 [Planomonospora parontospora subsp. antibiotica]GII17719.1 hypothetical protein Ppa05_44450 [Planomonospora parontospora subsp. antibiotica]